MAEVFGVVAAATQLAGACLGLIELMSKIKGATSMLLRYQTQFQELRDLSLSISQNPLLQTDEVFSHTQSLLLFIQHISLEPLLRKGLVSRTWGLLRRDQYLAETSKSLEQRKSSLSLIISDIQARAIYEIRTDIRLMSDCGTEATLCEYQPDKPLKTDTSDDKDLYTIPIMSSRRTHKKSSRRQTSGSSSSSSSRSTTRHSQDNPGASAVYTESVTRLIDSLMSRNNINPNAPVNMFDGNASAENQRNGHRIDQFGSVPGGTNIWKNNTCDGNMQHNWSDSIGDTIGLGHDGASPGALPDGQSAVGPTFNIFQGNRFGYGEGLDNDKWQVNGYNNDMGPLPDRRALAQSLQNRAQGQPLNQGQSQPEIDEE